MNSRILLWLALASFGTPAAGHAFLKHAAPGAGTTIGSSPGRVVLTFSEKLEPVFSGVAVVDAMGRSVESGPVISRGNSLIAPLRPLAPGKYRVTWHAVSVDTHRTEGAYSFVVRP